MNLDVNKQVFEIWEKYRKFYIEDPPGEYDYKGKSLLLKKDERKDPLKDLIPITYNKNEYKKSKKSKRWLFAGFNPSFNEEHYRIKCEIEKPYDFFSYEKLDENKEEAQKVDYSLRKENKDLKENYYKTYFEHVEKFIDWIVKENKDDLHHVHIDPFFIRGTSQKEAQSVLGIGNLTNVKKEFDQLINKFAKDQLDLFEEMIESYQPTAIIILNASASHLLSRKWGNNDFNTTFKAKIKKLDSIPVFCGGMLFGAGTLDKYSKQRFAKEIRDKLITR